MNNKSSTNQSGRLSLSTETEELQDQPQRPMEAHGIREHQDEWKLSIRRNNDAITSFLQGSLLDAHRLFMEASVLQRMAFYDERNGSREYRCKWVNIHSTALRSMNPSYLQSSQMSHVFMLFLQIDEKEECEGTDELPPVAPDVYLANLHWAVDFNLALASQLLGIFIPDGQGMHLRALSFDAYEQVERDIVDWYDDDGLAPLSVAIFVMAIYNNQGAMFCQLKVQTQMESYWRRMQKIWNRAFHLFRKHFVCSLFQRNLEYLEEATIGTQSASAA